MVYLQAINIKINRQRLFLFDITASWIFFFRKLIPCPIGHTMILDILLVYLKYKTLIAKK